MKKAKILLYTILMAYSGAAQDSGIAQIAVWKPFQGQEGIMENGYRQHLQWHLSNKDSWNWYGWMIVSGPRYGQFIDGTFMHCWSDFDSAVNPAGDAADNRLHLLSFASVQQVMKLVCLYASDMNTHALLSSKILRMTTIVFNNLIKPKAILKEYIAGENLHGTPDKILVFQVLDGGDLNQIILLQGLNDNRSRAGTELFNDHLLALFPSGMIQNISSETLVFKPDLSINVSDCK